MVNKELEKARQARQATTPQKVELKWYVKYGVIAIVALLAFLILKPFVVIDGGERGVVFNKFVGVKDDVCGEGLCWKIPMIEKVIKYEVRTQKYEASASAASKDLQVVTTSVALNFHLMHDRVNKIYQNVGTAIVERILQPAIQESVKAATAKYKAEDLVENRETVKEHIKDILKGRLSDYYIALDDLSITNFEFSPEFAGAIEAKARAEQDALQARNVLERVKYEAQQAKEKAEGIRKAIILEAEGEYQAMTLKNKAIKDNQEIIRLSAIEKWNGVLPILMAGNGNMPFIMDAKGLVGSNAGTS